MGKRSFAVIGRIIYEYDQGNWNEWHLVMNDGASGWLSDAQTELCGHVRRRPGKTCRGVQIGQQYTWDNQTYFVSTITKAHYRGVEGELPFQYWDKSDVVFVDLMSHTAEVRHD